MRFFSDKKYNKIFGYCLAFAITTLLIVVVLFQWDTVSGLGRGLLKIFNPVIWGAVIAFIMNPMVKSAEKFLSRFIFKNKPMLSVSRALGIIFASVVIILVIALVILSVIPELIANIPGIYDGLVNDFLPAVQEWVTKLLDDNPSISGIINNELNTIASAVKDLVTGLVPQLTNLLTSLLDFANSVKNFILGFILAIYFLFSKESLQAQAKRFVVAMFNQKVYHSIFSLTSNTNHALLSFIYGKIIDSAIVGILCALCLYILNIPYVMIISLIIGITNIIPVFGPFIGAIPSAVLVLIASPNKLIMFIIFVIVLQQVDGNIIGPKILGDKIGLSSFWVLFSILICGSMFGIVGMIIGVPLFAVMFDLVGAILSSRLKEKGMPTDKDYYSMPGVMIGTVTDSVPNEPIMIEQQPDQSVTKASPLSTIKNRILNRKKKK